MLKSVPQGTIETGLHQMEIHEHLGGEESGQTIWKELTEEFEEELKWVHITSDSIWNTAREREIKRPFTQSERKLIASVQTSESVTQTRFWRLRPDGLVFRLSTKTKSGILCILEFKRMSDVTDQYLIRVHSRAENQYVSLKRALGVTLHHQGSQVEQISFRVSVPQ